MGQGECHAMQTRVDLPIVPESRIPGGLLSVMSVRLLSIFVLSGTMAACGGNSGTSKSGLEQVEAESRAKAAENGAIDCAIAGSTDFKRTCQVEREIAEGELVLTIRHEDGGFRRLRVLKDGRGVVAADGAEPAVVQTLGTNAIEVTVGGDRYRLPATVKK
jgi:hypothetical protein